MCAVLSYMSASPNKITCNSSHYVSIILPWILYLYDNIQDPAHHTLLALQGDTVDDIHIVCSLIFLVYETVVLLLSDGDDRVNYL